jgi:putative endonuclease
MSKKGRKAEDKAVDYLASHDHKVVTRNYYCYRGEIDVITFDDDYVVFVEVKSRGSGSYVSPEEAITREKKRRLVKCAKRWLMENEYRGNARFDVVAISEDEISHYENAIELRSL